MADDFNLARRLTSQHLIVQPSDLALNPPESYLFVQDGLIISCGVLYVLCYIFYMIRTYKDKHLAGTVYFLCGTMSFELYYAVVMTSTAFELGCFLMWFLFDVSFVAVAIASDPRYGGEGRRAVIGKMIAGVIAGLGFFHWVCIIWPDERQQVTAYWTGWLLQLPISLGSLVILLRDGDIRGQSLEIWYVQLTSALLSSLLTVHQDYPMSWLLYSLRRLPVAVLECARELAVCRQSVKHCSHCCYNPAGNHLSSLLHQGAQPTEAYGRTLLSGHGKDLMPENL
jgi:hypothetical protein